jgi:hypothetical protein
MLRGTSVVAWRRCRCHDRHLIRRLLRQGQALVSEEANLEGVPALAYGELIDDRAGYFADRARLAGGGGRTRDPKKAGARDA